MRPFRVFDYETLSVLGEAYDSALASIRLAARAPVVGNTVAIRLLGRARSEQNCSEMYRAEGQNRVLRAL